MLLNVPSAERRLIEVMCLMLVPRSQKTRMMSRILMLRYFALINWCILDSLKKVKKLREKFKMEIPKQMVKSNAQTHQTNENQLAYIPDFVQALLYVVNGGLYLVL